MCIYRETTKCFIKRLWQKCKVRSKYRNCIFISKKTLLAIIGTGVTSVRYNDCRGESLNLYFHFVRLYEYFKCYRSGDSLIMFLVPSSKGKATIIYIVDIYFVLESGFIF